MKVILERAFALKQVSTFLLLLLRKYHWRWTISPCNCHLPSQVSVWALTWLSFIFTFF